MSGQQPKDFVHETDPTSAPTVTDLHLETRRASLDRRILVWAMVPALLLGGLLVYVAKIHDFLAISRPVHSDILVVEGWFPKTSAIPDASDVIRRGHYRSVVCVAIDLTPIRTSRSASDARQTALRLIALGVDARLIWVLDVPNPAFTRTFHCGLAVRDWLHRRDPTATSIDLFSVGIHARKSQIFYQKALGQSVRVGIIAGSESAYPVAHWWRSRHGIYLMVRNTIGYLYARAYFPTQPLPAPGSVKYDEVAGTSLDARNAGQ